MSKKGTIAFLLGILIALACGLYAIAPAHAGYLPSDEFLNKIQQHLDRMPPHPVPGVVGDVPAKEIGVGKPYREGNVAYFAAVAYGYFFLRLQTWEKNPDGNFLLTDCKMLPQRMICAKITLTPEGRRLPEDIKEQWFEPGNPIAIKKSEQAQLLLLQHMGEQEL